MEIPQKLFSSTIKKCSDGSIKIILPDKEAEAWLDKNCKRIKGSLRWWPEEDSTKFDLLRPYFYNKTVYIIGKGPSLDKICEEDFLPDLPIIAINDSIHKIETLAINNPLFMMQQDSSLERKANPKRAIPIVSYRANRYFKTYKTKVVYNPSELGCMASTLTVSCAICLCLILKVKDFIFLCFDSCMTQNCDYAECIGYKSDLKHSKKRFLYHKAQIIDYVKDTPYQFKSVIHA